MSQNRAPALAMEARELGNSLAAPGDSDGVNRTKKRGTAVAVVLLAAMAAGCGGNDVELSPVAAQGRDIADGSGCVACHGADGGGGVGPAWRGLAGTTVTLEDGREVVADTAYLRHSILDPGADLVEGYTTKMPQVDLTDDEVDALVAYIEELK